MWGLGTGMTFQGPNLAAQTVLKREDVPVGLALMLFSQLMGGAIFICVGQSVLNNQLLKSLAMFSGFNSASFISENGVTTLRDALPPEMLQPVMSAYNTSLRKTFQVGLILTCVAILGSISLEWRSIKKPAVVKTPNAERETMQNST